MSPLERYRDGYERGRMDSLAGHVAEAMFGMLQDDPGGCRAAGYRDGAAGAKFKPPSEHPAGGVTMKALPGASSVAKQWWVICDSSEFISGETVQYFSEALTQEGNPADFVVGLSKFSGQTCPLCTLDGQFKVHFLGRIAHPACGWDGFLPTGAYIGHQLTQVIHSGTRAAGHLKDDSDRKGEKGGWVNGIFGFMMVAAARALAATVLIPIHCGVTLRQPNQSRSATVLRSAILAGSLVALMALFYKAGNSR